MIGDKQKLQPKLFYHSINLEHRIPDNHPLRKIDRVVDFNFVRREVQSLYGTNGNKSVDPIVILKLMFLLFFENVSSERALMSHATVRILMKLAIDGSCFVRAYISQEKNRSHHCCFLGWLQPS
jgi:transposase